MEVQYAIGLMSGTSLDGVDAALVNFSQDIQLIHKNYVEFPVSLQKRIQALISGSNCFLKDVVKIEGEITDFYVLACKNLLKLSGLTSKQIRVIGCHGQTVWHAPASPIQNCFQLGNPHRLAHKMRIPVVYDFRRADIAAGGQGAPLVPLFHQALLQHQNENRAVLNLGGFCNISVFTPKSDCIGFDIGPCNSLLNLWIEHHRGEKLDFDGKWSASGTVINSWVEHALADPFFAKSPPKSTGREYFDLQWIQKISRLASTENAPAADIQASISDAIAHSIANAINTWTKNVSRCFLCGGGRKNLDLASRIQKYLPNMIVETIEHSGFDGDYIEAIAFAWLGWQRVHSKKIDYRKITGSQYPTYYGVLVEF
ncbi:MAG: anhydro-N-acetylmuramic acid kinase [Pseudomonadota bacterium]